MTPRARRRSPLSVQVLQLLDEEPMHAYGMQRLIAERHKERIVNIAQRNSIYQTLDGLLRGNLIEVHRTERDPGRPERTVYRLTESGRATLDAWLRTMLSAPAQEFPEFPVAIAAIPSLTPELTIELLAKRVCTLQEKLDRADDDTVEAEKLGLPRLFSLEHEYLRVLTEAELRWVQEVLDDLRAGRLTWDRQWLAEVNHRLSSG
ncbi:DNA-binding PadR family transcriptional regulator [Actinoalloteichus hoggarensis]|uniref:Transcriptional regulator PadR-like family protein n=2 Tax=Actinoalloteichus hoggarensis TaxID=1470176 RepID=A0A221VXX5_9PSEU|nr:PadR family transcriptional regulator [Actinoalloteichus hoggarensis]ASO18348.1 Transcriptional regulator PadR-like family protein [Actinoalloteichus hoggarensis]MBB5921711.1 DNA-binding PadR family transcriptional regulator [Actinoalloteichus hoggarensis]